MPAYGVIGAQWGDEGKGKVVDYLAQGADMVVRFSGGNNAGHTVINEKGEFKLHLVPSGVFRPHITCVIGSGTVVDPGMLLEEIDGLVQQGVDVGRLLLSDHAHVVMPYHVLLDRLEEEARGSNAIGTTGRGIGPAYMDKAARVGVRVGDLLDRRFLSERLESVVKQKNRVLTGVYGADPIDPKALLSECLEYGERLRPYVASAELRVSRALQGGARVVLEGAQGTLLDIDHGTYPFVTSSSPTIGGACTGLGIPPQEIKAVLGVFKAYSTRVGAGPLVSELDDEVADKIRERAWEYGTTTGRPRRVGWFDAVAGRYGVTVNGFTSCVLTRLDVLDGISPVKVCVAYDVDGARIKDFPSVPGLLERGTPVWEEMPGWTTPTAGATSLDQLPPEAIAYVKRLEELVGCSMDLISTGPRREESIEIRPVFS